MAMASLPYSTAIEAPKSFPYLHTNRLFFTRYRIPSLAVSSPPFSLSAVCAARRRSNAGRPINKRNKKRIEDNPKKMSDVDEDAFEALFEQLEEDLKNDDASFDDVEDEISGEELAMLERELEEALAEDDDILNLLNPSDIDTHEEVDAKQEEEHVERKEEEEDEDEDVEEESVQIKGWQLRRLARALKVGRRKTSIKNLAADLCLDRAIVLKLLRDPPPNLLVLSSALPDEPEPTPIVPEPDVTQPRSDGLTPDLAKRKPDTKTPIHALQGSWSAQKRLKRVHVETLERVYQRTKRPTNTMISSIVHVTNLPRRRVVKWFEDKRAAEGVPEHRRPYLRPSDSVFVQ